MTYLQILNTIKDTALAQPNVNSVVREFLDLNREDAKYSAVVIQDRDGSRDRIEEQDYITYTWHLGYVDRLTYDESNRDDIISTGINIINNIVNTIRNTWFPELEVSLSDRINTFDQRFTAQCAGVYGVLSVNALVSDCIDSESGDIYDKFKVEITENGDYHFVPSGKPVDEIDITVNVENRKPEQSLVETITSNGSYIYSPEEGSVFSDANITVDVHPSISLSETYTTNGAKNITGEFNGGTINIDVHPSNKLVEAITSNGITDLSGEWKDASITVDVHPTDTLSRTYVSNGSYNITGEWKDASIKVEVPSDKKPEESLIETITTNGEKTITGEFNGGVVTVDVHPSNKLVKTITSNGSYNYPGEYAGAEIMVSVSGGSKPEESLVETITSNGSYSYSPSSGSVFSDASITVNVPSNDVVTMTQAEYNALSNKNPNTIYLING